MSWGKRQRRAEEEGFAGDARNPTPATTRVLAGLGGKIVDSALTSMIILAQLDGMPAMLRRFTLVMLKQAYCFDCGETVAGCSCAKNKNEESEEP